MELEKTFCRQIIVLIVASTNFGGVEAIAQVPEWADTIIFNGKVIQADAPQPQNSSIAEAIAIKHGKILAVGSNSEIQTLAHDNTRRIDVQGRTVLPGLIDTHSHLQGYGIAHFGPELVPELRQVRVQGGTWNEVKNNTLEAIRLRVAKARPGEWISIAIPGKFKDPNGNSIASTAAVFAPWGVIPGTKEPVVTRAEIDKLAPNNPVQISASASAIFNTHALELIEAFYGQLKHPRLNIETGASGVLLERSVKADIIVGDLETYAEILKRESEEWVSFGITTFSTSIDELSTIRAYYQLEQQGEMPQRLAFSHGWGITANPHGPNFYRYYGIPDGFGSSRIWTVGVAATNLDHIPPNVEMSLEVGEVTQHTKDQEFSWLRDTSPGNLTEVLKAQLIAGHSLKGNHIGGDATLDLYMDIIESVARDRGWSDELIRNRAIAYDHSRIYPRPDQIPRMARLGIQASIGPKYIGEPDLIELYGKEIVDTWQVPTRGLIEGGVLTAWEIDTHEITEVPGNAFYYLEKLVTREMDDVVHGAENRVDRLTALYTATRWAAEYVRRKDTLGSIEPGKWADIVVLERDFLEVPDHEIHTVNPVLVMVGGEIEYQQ